MRGSPQYSRTLELFWRLLQNQFLSLSPLFFQVRASDQDDSAGCLFTLDCFPVVCPLTLGVSLGGGLSTVLALALLSLHEPSVHSWLIPVVSNL